MRTQVKKHPLHLWIPIVLIMVLVLCGTAEARAEFDDGVVAYLMGDYDKAFATLRALAEGANHGYSQYYLGMMYLQGQGTEQDDKQAAQWFRRAAENHIPQAQYRLGLLYLRGKGVPKDYEYAYAWFRTSATLQHSKAKEAISEARTKLPNQDMTNAEALAEEFIEKYGPEEKLDLSQPIRIDN